MKSTYIKFIFLFTIITINQINATDLNGRINVLTNDGNNYKVLLQINVDPQPAELGGATIVIDFDTTLLNFPDEPVYGIDYVFSNFTLGYYDSAKVSKSRSYQLWINIDLTTDGNGTLVQSNPNEWTDLVQLNFVANNIITDEAIFWNINNEYWKVYGSDNLTNWEIGNFDNIITSTGTEILNTPNNDYEYNLSQNYPNPFNPSTIIQYSVPEESFVKLEVFNSLGQLIKTLVSEEKQRGTYNYNFEAEDLSSGIYLYRLLAGDYIVTKKMLLIK